MQKSTLDTDFSYRLFGSKKSKLIDKKVCGKLAKSFLLMLRAAEAAKKFLLKEKASSVTIFIGKGNNGEDGLCLAALLKIENIKTLVIDLDHKNRPKTYAYNFCLNLEVNIEKYNTKKIPKADWYVDAIFGVGLNRNLTGDYLKAVNYLQCSASKKILSLKKDGSLLINYEKLNKTFCSPNIFGKDLSYSSHYSNIAAMVQKDTEEVIFDILNFLYVYNSATKKAAPLCHQIYLH